MPPTIRAASTDRNGLVRVAREALDIARYYEDEQGEEEAFARLAALGVDEAGDDLQTSATVRQ